jgi:hypothetical protein
MTKALVAEKILRVEDGVDEFRNYLERRGDNARCATSTAQQSGRASGCSGTAHVTTTQKPLPSMPEPLHTGFADLMNSKDQWAGTPTAVFFF